MPSSVIRFFRYDAARRVLLVVFQSGRRYRYLDVPQVTHDDLRASRSKGEYFNAHIRDRYRYERYERDAD